LEIIVLASSFGMANAFDIPDTPIVHGRNVGRADLPRAIAANSIMFNRRGSRARDRGIVVGWSARAGARAQRALYLAVLTSLML